MKIREVGSGTGIRREASGLIPGQVVRGRVVARIGQKRFLVTIRGYLLSAASDLALEPGQPLTARVEVCGDRLFLRIQDEDNGNGLPPFALEDPEETKRVLQLLGHQPGIEDICEFQERLNRYRPYGSLPGCDPSDIWILAILWTRGIRSGADSFALTSYYLRAQPPPNSKGDLFLPDFDQILPFLQFEQKVERPTELADSVEDDSLVPGIEHRRAEAILRLNREEAAQGNYGEISGDQYLKCGLFRDLADVKKRMIRLADHPVWPDFVIEWELLQKDNCINARIHTTPMSLSEDRVAKLQSQWHDQAQRLNFILREMHWNEIQDAETLRAAFWRKWDDIPCYDRRA